MAFSSIFILFALIITKLTRGMYVDALVILVGILPIIISLVLIRKGMLSLPITIFAINAILLLTYISTVGQGIYNVSVIGFPLVLIVTGLILKGRVIPYLTGFIFCAWYGLYLEIFWVSILPKSL